MDREFKNARLCIPEWATELDYTEQSSWLLFLKHLDDIESILTRQGYGLRELVQACEAKPAEIKELFVNQLDPVRSAELRDRMHLAGLPI